MIAPSEAARTESLPKIVPKITSEWRCFEELSPAALYELLQFRQRIFVVEQTSPYADLDGLDQEAWHLLLSAGDALVGCLRLVPPADPRAAVRIGRVAVAAGWRRRGFGRRLMEEALSLCRDHWPGRPMALAAQLYLVPFYESFGFAAAAAPYDDCGVPHVEMTLTGPASPARSAR
jgi:ElaA protein